MESNILKIKISLCFLLFLFFAGKGIHEFIYSDPEAYGLNIKNSLKRVSFTVSYIKCHKKSKTADYVELVAKENNKTLHAYAGPKCKEIEQNISIGDYITVDAILENSNILGIIKNGNWLMDTQKSIDGSKSNYSNFYIIYLAISLSLFFGLLHFWRQRLHT